MNNITTKHVDERLTFWFNEIYLGYAYIEVDGFYQFKFPYENNGVWSAWALRKIADILDNLNAPIEKSIAEYFNNADSRTTVSVGKKLKEDEAE